MSVTNETLSSSLETNYTNGVFDDHSSTPTTPTYYIIDHKPTGEVASLSSSPYIAKMSGAVSIPHSKYHHNRIKTHTSSPSPPSLAASSPYVSFIPSAAHSTSSASGSPLFAQSPLKESLTKAFTTIFDNSPNGRSQEKTILYHSSSPSTTPSSTTTSSFTNSNTTSGRNSLSSSPYCTSFTKHSTIIRLTPAKASSFSSTAFSKPKSKLSSSSTNLTFTKEEPKVSMASEKIKNLPQKSAITSALSSSSSTHPTTTTPLSPSLKKEVKDSSSLKNEPVVVSSQPPQEKDKVNLSKTPMVKEPAQSSLLFKKVVDDEKKKDTTTITTKVKEEVKETPSELDKVDTPLTEKATETSISSSSSITNSKLTSKALVSEPQSDEGLISTTTTNATPQGSSTPRAKTEEGSKDGPIVRRRRKSVNFSTDTFKFICTFTTTDTPKDIQKAKVEVKNDDPVSEKEDKDFSELRNYSTAWSSVPRNVIHIQKFKSSKAKHNNCELPVRIQSFKLVAANANETEDVYSCLKINLAVQNLDFHKKVVVRYTVDKWKTFHEVEAVYVKCLRESSKSEEGIYGINPLVGLDRFTARIDASKYFVLEEKPGHICNQRPKKMLLVARYEVNNKTYWDNNDFSDYQVELVRINAGYDVPRVSKHGKPIPCPGCTLTAKQRSLNEKSRNEVKECKRAVRKIGGVFGNFTDAVTQGVHHGAYDFVASPSASSLYGGSHEGQGEGQTEKKAVEKTGAASQTTPTTTSTTSTTRETKENTETKEGKETKKSMEIKEGKETKKSMETKESQPKLTPSDPKTKSEALPSSPSLSPFSRVSHEGRVKPFNSTFTTVNSPSQPKAQNANEKVPSSTIKSTHFSSSPPSFPYSSSYSSSPMFSMFSSSPTYSVASSASSHSKYSVSSATSSSTTTTPTSIPTTNTTTKYNPPTSNSPMTSSFSRYNPPTSNSPVPSFKYGFSSYYAHPSPTTPATTTTTTTTIASTLTSSLAPSYPSKYDPPSDSTTLTYSSKYDPPTSNSPAYGSKYDLPSTLTPTPYTSKYDPPTSAYAYTSKYDPPTSNSLAPTYGSKYDPPTSNSPISSFGSKYDPPTSNSPISSFGSKYDPPTSNSPTPSSKYGFPSYYSTNTTSTTASPSSSLKYEFSSPYAPPATSASDYSPPSTYTSNSSALFSTINSNYSSSSTTTSSPLSSFSQYSFGDSFKSKATPSTNSSSTSTSTSSTLSSPYSRKSKYDIPFSDYSPFDYSPSTYGGNNLAASSTTSKNTNNESTSSKLYNSTHDMNSLYSSSFDECNNTMTSITA